MATLDYQNFTPKNAIVTGAAQGIGRAIALRLAADGLNLVLNDIPQKKQVLEELVKEISNTFGVKAAVYAGCVAEKSVNDGMVETCVEHFGSLDVMVCNAGMSGKLKGVLDVAYEEVETLMTVNFQSCWFGYSAAAQQMIKQNTGGRIIGASSVAGKKGGALTAGYSATKFSIRALTQSAAQEWGQFGITVNAYCPGIVLTAMIKDIIQPGMKEGWESTAALRRVGEPEDISGVVSFFASKDSRYITGQSLNIDGGVCFDYGSRQLRSSVLASLKTSSGVISFVASKDSRYNAGQSINIDGGHLYD
ncbi:NAD(P)-binding protein [Cylindrobasidium torrendii FP15055 ss-10]|uniref:NAD(P)-binding protein n=1 Tax=Cylindrobasidium torrendii FP15055 ss-10 TaxID=1314674 RepID=A0A0D7AXJ1_9AGAR|nr:NAD(P)-binding protein [Cylindrobasidium torrendii FP15055 ss-10]